jgi:mannose-6-phosphate isomerase-like protein (cupin superfamily)
LPETLSLTPSESIAVRESTPDLLEAEATYGPGGEPPPAHFHPSQDEHFEVLAGEIRVRINGEERALGKGEELEIPRGVQHQMWNPGAETARVRWQTRPALRTHAWWRSVDAIRRSGRVGTNGMGGVGPEWLALANRGPDRGRNLAAHRRALAHILAKCRTANPDPTLRRVKAK